MCFSFEPKLFITFPKLTNERFIFTISLKWTLRNPSSLSNFSDPARSHRFNLALWSIIYLHKKNEPLRNHFCLWCQFQLLFGIWCETLNSFHSYEFDVFFSFYHLSWVNWDSRKNFLQYTQINSQHIFHFAYLHEYLNSFQYFFHFDPNKCYKIK